MKSPNIILPTKYLALTFIHITLLVIVFHFNQAYSQETRQPNIVIIFADDLGYGDLGCYGATGYRTPELDRLAESGVKFTDFYVSEAVCSASRSALLTGCYSERIGIQGALTPGSFTGLKRDEVTIAEMLNEKKYKTAIFGKWHLGHNKKFLPLTQGFDEYFGLPYSNDMWPVGYDGKPAEDNKSRYPTLMLYEGNKPVMEVNTLEDQAMLTTLYTERAVRFIEKNRKKPFFLYLAHSMPHVPLAASEEFRGTTEYGLFGDVVSEVDWSVGRIMETLEEYGLTGNTLVIFTSDNGPWLSMGNHAGNAGPLREGKGTAFEGGVRVPCIISWPGMIERNWTCSDLVTTMDLLPSIADITGAPLPDHPIDGINIFPQLVGESSGIMRRNEFWYYYGGELRAIRVDNWKIIFPHHTVSYEGVEPGHDGYPGKYAYLTTGLELYNLAEDIGERNDVAGEYPEIVENMQSMADEARKELGDRLTGVKGNGVRQPGRLYAAKDTKLNHVAVGSKVTLDVVPNPKYPGEGPGTLVDGYRGSMDFYDGRWLGFWGQDIEVTIDLGRKVKVRRISCSFMENQGSWIFLPKEVDFFVSDDGTDYQQLNQFLVAMKQDPTSRVREFETLVNKGEARYFKISIKNAGKLPDWHPGKGQDPWVFIDEVMIR